MLVLALHLMVIGGQKRSLTAANTPPSLNFARPEQNKNLGTMDQKLHQCKYPARSSAQQHTPPLMGVDNSTTRLEISGWTKLDWPTLSYEVGAWNS